MPVLWAMLSLLGVAAASEPVGDDSSGPYPLAVGVGTGTDYAGIGIKALARYRSFAGYVAVGSGSAYGIHATGGSIGGRFHLVDAGVGGVFAQAGLSPVTGFDVLGEGHFVYGPSLQGGAELRTFPFFAEGSAGLGAWRPDNDSTAMELCWAVGFGLNFGPR